MRLKKKVSLMLACVVSICCIIVSAMAAENPIDNDSIENTQGSLCASKTFEVTVSARANANANIKDAFSVEVGESVRIRGTYSPVNASVDFGLIDSAGVFHYVNVKDGNIDQTFKISKADNYRLGIRNNSDNTVKVSGFVRY